MRTSQLFFRTGAFAFFAAAPLFAQDQAPLAPEVPLFQTVPSERVSRFTDLTEATRQRNVWLDFASLENDEESGPLAPVFKMELFDGESVRGSVDDVAEAPGGYIVRLKLQDEEDGYALISVVEGAATATIRSQERLFKLNHVGSGEHTLSRIDELQVQACGGAVEPPVGHGGGHEPPPENFSDNLDLLVVYTDDARVANGGESGIRSLINLAVFETNEGWAKSDVRARAQLVHAAEVSFNESGSISTWLSQLRSTTDGVIDQVHDLRDEYGADQVTLITRNSGGACGIGYLMTTLSNSFKTNAFTVVHDGCATGYYSFGHEIGHNIGCHHDKANAGNALYSYSYGYRTPDSKYRSVMAYSPGTRINMWSNPTTKSPNGWAMGINNQADNARSIDNAVATASGWRSTRDWYHQITTTHKSNNGFAGNMFDIKPKEAISLTGIDINTTADVGTLVKVRAWFRNGSYKNNTSSYAGWKYIGTYTMPAKGKDKWTWVNFTSARTFLPGKTYGMYIEYMSYGGSGGYLAYTNGAPKTFSNNQLDLISGVGKAVGAGSTTFQNRIWNGRLRYTGAWGQYTLKTNMTSNNGFAGIMFKIKTKDKRVQVSSLDLNIAGSGLAIADVWYRKGSYAGVEKNPDAWTFLGSDSKSPAAGQNKATRISFGEAKLQKNTTYSFYVNLRSYGDSSQSLRYLNGQSTYSNAHISVSSGVGRGDGAFTGSIFTPRQFSGRVRYNLW